MALPILSLALAGSWLAPSVAAVTGADIITTVSGNGSPTFAGDGGPARSAYLNDPRDVAFDSAGNMYIADTYNHRIRRIDATTGVITTIAGTGVIGFSGDGGPATAARLYSPTGIALDGDDNLYIADNQNMRVRKVLASNGVISTVAGNGVFGFAGDGGAATSARLNYPYSVETDADGNLYIADTQNHRIRFVDSDTGVITTIAGTGVAGFSADGGPATASMLNRPQGLEIDAHGDLLFADVFNHRVRKIDSHTGVIDTIAGTGIAGYGGDGSQATSALFSFPIGLVVADDGTLYIGDWGNHRVRKMDPSGTITTVAGTGTSGFSGDGGQAFAARLFNPYGMDIDTSGNLYVADENNHRVRKISLPPDGMPSSIVSWWRGEGNANDSVDGNHGTGLNGVSFVPGHHGLAFSFDGVNDYVNLGRRTSLSPTSSDFSISGWFNIPQYPNNGYPLCAARYPIIATAWGWSVDVLGSGQLRFAKYTTQLASAGVGSATPVSTGVWHHFAAVHTSSGGISGAGHMRIYVDGLLSSAIDNSTAAVYYEPGPAADLPADDLLIGRRGCASSHWNFKGSIDEVAFYSRALSGPEVEAMVDTDTTPPEITAADVTAEATGPDGATVSYAQPTANDDVDGAVAVSCTPPSGETFPLGDTTVECQATDAAGNTGYASFTVSVVDTTPPTVEDNLDIVAEATGPGGANVAYTTPTAEDIVDGAVAVDCSPSSGSPFPLGDTTVECLATDAAGNTGGSSFTITVEDTTAPSIAVHGQVNANATGPTGANVIYVSPSASDAVDGFVAVSCTPVSGSLFAVGDTTVECEATDAAGNSAQSSFTVHVAGATEQLGNLTNFVTGIGPGGSLQAKATKATTYLAAGDVGSACNTLKALANEAKAQSGKKLTTAQANSIIASANRIRAVLAC